LLLEGFHALFHFLEDLFRSRIGPGELIEISFQPHAARHGVSLQDLIAIQLRELFLGPDKIEPRGVLVVIGCVEIFFDFFMDILLMFVLMSFVSV
jgi:hypothetical protein